MTRLGLALLALLLATGLLTVGVGAARADGDPDTVSGSFQKFCEQWMAKLDNRRQFSLRRAEAEPAGEQVLLHYRDYSPTAVLCEVKPGKDGSAIGRLVYHELQMEKSGKNRKKALANQPNVLSRTEVMEIFRFDGKRWKY